MKDRIEQQSIDAQQWMRCMHQGVIVTSVDGTILEATPAAESIFEARAASLKSRQIRELCLSVDAYDEIIRKTDAAVRSLNTSVIILAGHAKRKIVNLSVQRVAGAENARYVHVFQDCADLRATEERLLQSERLATIGRFASQIAHEIRNPLGSISLNVELIEEELKEGDEEAKHLIRSILKELDRLNDIVSEYLQFSRFSKPRLRRARVDNVILELVNNFKAPRSVRVDVALMASSPEVWIDEPLLHEALENLLRNGAEAIDGDGVLRIETAVVDRFLVIRVKDTGRGIEPQIQARLFEPFFTTKADGTGLGLATSQQIVFEHNGRLVVESQPGRGSTFTTLLPL